MLDDLAGLAFELQQLRFIVVRQQIPVIEQIPNLFPLIHSPLMHFLPLNEFLHCTLRDDRRAEPLVVESRIFHEISAEVHSLENVCDLDKLLDDLRDRKNNIVRTDFFQALPLAVEAEGR